MKNILLIKVWKNKISALAGIVTFFVILLWPAITLRGLDVWIQTLISLFPTNIFYPILSFLTASFVAIYVYNKKVAPCCPVNSTKTGSSASAIGVILGACPACIPALAFFLPLSATIFLSYLSGVFLIAAIALLLFSIHRMGGFRKI